MMVLKANGLGLLLPAAAGKNGGMEYWGIGVSNSVTAILHHSATSKRIDPTKVLKLGIPNG